MKYAQLCLLMASVTQAKKYVTNPVGGPRFEVNWAPEKNAYRFRADVREGQILNLVFTSNKNSAADIVRFDATTTDGQIIDMTGVLGPNGSQKDPKSYWEPTDGNKGVSKNNGLYFFDAYHPVEVTGASDSEKVVRFRAGRAQQFLWGWNGQLDKWILSTNSDFSIVGDESGEGDADGDHLDPNNYLISKKCLENRSDITADERTNNIFCISGYLPSYFDEVNNKTQGAIWDYLELF
jgi:hypothetical protein